MKQLQKPYEDDEVFRRLADASESFFGKNGFTSLDTRSAGALACLRHEMTTARRDFARDILVNEAFPELGLIVRQPTKPRQESLTQRNRERPEVLQKPAMSETPGEALEILSAWRERRKAFDCSRCTRDALHRYVAWEVRQIASWQIPKTSRRPTFVGMRPLTKRS